MNNTDDQIKVAKNLNDDMYVTIEQDKYPKHFQVRLGDLKNYLVGEALAIAKSADVKARAANARFIRYA